MKPENMPTRKVTSAVLAGAMSVILIWVLSLVGVEVPGTVGAAFATVLSFITAYMVPENASS